MAMEMAYQWGWHFTEFPCRKKQQRQQQQQHSDNNHNNHNDIDNDNDRSIPLMLGLETIVAHPPINPHPFSSSERRQESLKYSTSIATTSNVIELGRWWRWSGCCNWMYFVVFEGEDFGTNRVGTWLLYMFYGAWWCFFLDEWDERFAGNPTETRILKKGVRCSTGFAMFISFLLDGFAIHHHLEFRSLKSIRFCQAFE